MDIRGKVMGSQSNDFLHKIASIIPGYTGYVDRERRRDADKILRVQLAQKYTEQRQRLTRVQQTLLRSHDLNSIGQVDHQAGNLQRFIDRLQNATYGYAGMFDPIKVEAADLDQLYAFDMALANGVTTLSGAINSVESAAGSQDRSELPAAVDRLASMIDDLNLRFNQRNDLLTSGSPLPAAQYQSLVNDLQQPTATGPMPPAQPMPYSQPATYAPPTPAAPYSPSYGQGTASFDAVPTGSATPAPGPAIPGYGYSAPGNSPSTYAWGSEATNAPGIPNIPGGMEGGAPTGPIATAGIAGRGASNQDAQSPTSSGPVAEAGAGEQHNILPVNEPSISGRSGETGATNIPANEQPAPGVDSMAEGNQGFSGTPTEHDKGGSSPMTIGGAAGTGVESASSPSVAPGAPGGSVVSGMSEANTLDSIAGTDISSTPGAGGERQS